MQRPETGRPSRTYNRDANGRFTFSRQATRDLAGTPLSADWLRGLVELALETAATGDHSRIDAELRLARADSLDAVRDVARRRRLTRNRHIARYLRRAARPAAQTPLSTRLRPAPVSSSSQPASSQPPTARRQPPSQAPRTLAAFFDAEHPLGLPRQRQQPVTAAELERSHAILAAAIITDRCVAKR